MILRVTQSLYLSVGRTLFRALVVLSLVSGVLTLSTTTAIGVDEAAQTIHLEPGDNYVGWVSDPIPVDEVFAAIPKAALIYTWDADRRGWRSAIRDVGGSLTALEPGMAAMIRIDGARAVQWERPLTPAKGMVPLYRGVNWVTWVGRDEWPLDQVARGIGTSLVSIRVGDETWPAPLDDSLEEFPTLSRGDALEVTVSRDLRWLQPTGITPDVMFLGDVPTEVRERFDSDIRSVLDYFAENFGVEADISRFSVLVVASLDSLLEHYGNSSDSERSWQVQSARSLWGRAGGWVAKDLVILSEAWQRDDQGAPYVLPHEYFHVLQDQLGHLNLPTWLVEGTAQWIHLSHGKWELHNDQQGDTPDDLWSSEFAVDFRHDLGCGHMSREVADWSYSEGTLATHHLVTTAGVQSILDFFRLLHASATYTWPAVFSELFGIEVAAFTESLRNWVTDVWTEETGSAPVSVPVTIRARHVDGTPMSDLEFHALGSVPPSSCWSEHSVAADETGVAVLGFVAGLPSVLIADLKPDDKLVRRLYYRDGDLVDGQDVIDEDGVVRALDAGEHLSFDVDRDASIDIVLPNDWYRWVLAGRVTDTDGRGIDSVPVSVWWLGGGYAWQITASSDGKWSTRVPASGAYRVQIRPWESTCTGWLQEDGSLGSLHSARVIQVDRAHVKDIAIELPKDSCGHLAARSHTGANPHGEPSANSGEATDSDEPVLLGTLNHGDGSPATEFVVKGARYKDGMYVQGSVNRSTHIADDGAFELYLTPNTTQRIWFERGNCTLSLTHDGLTSAAPATDEYRDLNTALLPRLDLEVPSGACAGRVDIRVVTLEAFRGNGATVYLVPEDGIAYGAHQASGQLLTHFAQLGGRYQVKVGFDPGGCTAWLGSDGLVASHAEAQWIVLSEDSQLLDIRQPPNVCAQHIAGRMLDVSGQPMSGAWLNLKREGGDPQGGATDWDGRFVFLVPADGRYKLYSWLDDCVVYRSRSGGSTLAPSDEDGIVVAGGDATGIVWVYGNLCE